MGTILSSASLMALESAVFITAFVLFVLKGIFILTPNPREEVLN